MEIRPTQVWRSTSASRRRWLAFWSFFLVLQIFTGSKSGIVVTGWLLLLQFVMMVKEYRVKRAAEC